MAEKIRNKDQIINFIFENENSSKVLLLFDSTPEKNQFSNEIENKIKSHRDFIIDRKVPLRITNSVIDVNNKRIILGLKGHEEELVNHYENEEVFYYGEGND